MNQKYDIEHEWYVMCCSMSMLLVNVIIFTMLGPQSWVLDEEKAVAVSVHVCKTACSNLLLLIQITKSKDMCMLWGRKAERIQGSKSINVSILSLLGQRHVCVPSFVSAGTSNLFCLHSLQSKYMLLDVIWSYKVWDFNFMDFFIGSPPNIEYDLNLLEKKTLFDNELSYQQCL